MLCTFVLCLRCCFFKATVSYSVPLSTSSRLGLLFCFSYHHYHHNNHNFNSVCFYLFFFFFLSTFLQDCHMGTWPLKRAPLPQFWRFIPYYFSFSRLWQFNFVFKNFFLYLHSSRPYSCSLLINLTHFTIWFSYFHIPSFLYSSSFSLTHLLSFYLHLLHHSSPLWL